MKNCVRCNVGFEVGSQRTKIYCSGKCRDLAKQKRQADRHESLFGTRHSIEFNERSSIRKKQRWNKQQQVVREYKLCHPCICGESDPVCLQFHHRDRNDKSFTIAHAQHHGIGIDILLIEMEKVRRDLC